MRNKNVLNLRKSLPCMSWSPKNLYNLWSRTVGPKSSKITFKNTSQETLFQQRWRAKAAVRAYHGDYIPEKSFKRWYLPDNIPDVRPRRKVSSNDDKNELEAYALRKVREKALEDEIERKGMAPVGSLMFSEVERRLDVVVFRCCFAHSIYEARRLVIHGDVMLNGKKHMNANTRLAPGDLISVNPAAIRFFKRIPAYTDDVNAITLKKAKPRSATPESTPTEGTSENADAPATTTAEAATEGPATTNATTDSAAPTAEASVETAPTDIEPSTQEVAAEETPKESPYTPFHLPPYASPWLFIPAYIEPSFSTCSAVYVRHPTARPGYSEIPTPYDADGALIRYAWEWYMQRRPRMRSKTQLARMPEDRAMTRLKDVHEERALLKRELWWSRMKAGKQTKESSGEGVAEAVA